METQTFKTKSSPNKKTKPSDGISTLICHADMLTYMDTSPLQHLHVWNDLQQKDVLLHYNYTSIAKGTQLKTSPEPLLLSSSPSMSWAALRALHRQLPWQTWYEKSYFTAPVQEHSPPRHTEIVSLSISWLSSYDLFIFLFASLLMKYKDSLTLFQNTPNIYMQKEYTYILGLNFITKKLWWEKNQYEVWTALRAPACTECHCITALGEASTASHICSKLAGST